MSEENKSNETWTAIERLQQGESLNVQDVKTNLFWEFGKFTSRDGESMESYYSRFYKLMNELTRNNLQVTTMQVNVQFLQQLQPEWRLPKWISFMLLAAAQPYSDNYYQAPKPQRTNTTSSSTRPSASTRHKGKEIAKPVTPQLRNKTEDTTPRKSSSATEWDIVLETASGFALCKGMLEPSGCKDYTLSQAEKMMM
ncbi:hypothetical protein Tco_1081244 [Tanacetum coccineum]|uniref:Uncharacterized protein n=1 Tax=Tanacetum coccineum TaxID=301880 RepID=A0ABQ5HYB7_9ASTR